MLRFLLLLSSSLSLAVAGAECGPVTVGYRVMTLAGRTVAVWYPASGRPVLYRYHTRFSGVVAADAPAAKACGKHVPLVIFSHGDLGCGLQSIFFTEELARAGYLVAAPDHADAFMCHSGPTPAEGHEKAPPQPNFLKPETWTESTFINRRDDVEAVIDALLADKEFKKIIDPKRIGMAGHSLGGYTALGLVGGWASWKDQRIRAVLAMSPYLLPYRAHDALQNIHVPLMYQGAKFDLGLTPFLTGPDGAYSDANPPAYFMELRRGAHLSWSNCGREHTTAGCLDKREANRLIDEYGIAFFNRYLKALPEPVLDGQSSALAKFLYKLAPIGTMP